MKKRRITEIVKAACRRYDVKYDENQSEIRVQLQDGSIRTVNKETFDQAFK